MLRRLRDERSGEDHGKKRATEGRFDSPDLPAVPFVSEFSRRLLRQLPMQGSVCAAARLCDSRIAGANLAAGE